MEGPEGGRGGRGFEPWLATGLPFVLFALGLWVVSLGDLDRRLTAPFFDAETGLWPLQNDFVVKTLLHRWGRNLVFLTGFSALVVFVAGFLRPRLARWRRRSLLVVLSIGLSTGSVTFIKGFSTLPCPKEDQRFGGELPHEGPFDAPPAGLEAGHCWPGAHAAGGFSFLCFYYVLRETHRRRAWLALLGAIVIGSIYGGAQVLRGQHFPSHNLASALIVWAWCSLLYWGLFRGRVSESSS